jgi:hypothetical protein
MSPTRGRTSKFTPEQMVHILRQGTAACRWSSSAGSTGSASKPSTGGGSGSATWGRGGPRAAPALKQVVAYLTLDKTILKEALGKKW